MNRQLPLLKLITAVFAFISTATLGQTATFTDNSPGGTETWTVPANVTSITVELWGGGAGGGTGGTTARGGGGGGAYTRAVIAVTPNSTISYSIGTGGAAGTNGGNTIFNTNIIANGGLTSINRNGGAGGAASTVGNFGVTLSYAGGAGGNARAASGAANDEAGGSGGGSGRTGGIGNAGPSATGAGQPGTATGGCPTDAGISGNGAAGNGNASAATGTGNGGGGRGEQNATGGSAGTAGRIIITFGTAEIALTGGTAQEGIGDGSTGFATANGTDFGNVNEADGSTATVTYVIFNQGQAPLTNIAVTIGGSNAADFTVVTAPPTSIGASSTAFFTVRFNPSATGTRTATINIASNDSDENPFNFDVRGTGVNPNISVVGGPSPYTTLNDGDNSPSTAEGTNFGTQRQNAGSITNTFVITNTGNGTLNLGAITIGAPFTATLNTNTVAPGGIAILQITYAPTASAATNTTCSIVTNCAGTLNPFNFSISANANNSAAPEIELLGVAPAQAPIALYERPNTAEGTDFGRFNTTDTSISRTFTIRNNGANTLSITGISSSAAAFTITAPLILPSTLLPLLITSGNTATFTVTFNPTTTGVITSIISLTNNDANETPFQFEVSGIGTSPEIEAFQGTNAVFNDNAAAAAANGTTFGTVRQTNGQTIKTFSIRNPSTATGTLTLSNPTSNNAQFIVSTLSDLSLEPGEVATFNITFDPTAASGTITGTISIANNDADENPFDINVSGIATTANGAEIRVRGGATPTDIALADVPTLAKGTNFGEVYAYSGNVTNTFIVNNDGAVTALTGGNITLTGTFARDFTVSITTLPTINAGTSTTFTITFDPSGAGTRTALVSIANGDADENPYTFTISGVGLPFRDGDGDDVTDNLDIDDDNDGIIDTAEQAACINNANAKTVVNTLFADDFGTGTARVGITINNPEASTTYALWDSSDRIVGDGRYVVYYKLGVPTGSGDPTGITPWSDYAITISNDHTIGDTDGRMLYVNADAIAGKIFYRMTINGVVPNVPLTFSYWVMNVDRSNQDFINAGRANEQPRLLPNVRTEILAADEATVIFTQDTGSITRCNSGDTCDPSDWKQVSYTFNPGNNTSVSFRLVSLGPGGLGNDIALDDFSMTQNLCDSDGDGFADVYDLDADNDGIPDITEAGYAVRGYNAANTASLATMNKAVASKWTDVTGPTGRPNGMEDSIDAQIAAGTYMLPDSDNDGTLDFEDLDSDNDGIFDIDEYQVDTWYTSNITQTWNNGDGDIDGDGKGDLSDSDRDGLLDPNDDLNGFGASAKPLAADSDNDGIPNYLDLTSNGSSFDINSTLFRVWDNSPVDGRIDSTLDNDRDGLTNDFDNDDTNFGSPRNLTLPLYIEFDGRNDYGESTQVLSNRAAASMMGWIKLTSTTSLDRIVMGQDNFFVRVATNSNTLSTTAKGVTVTSSTNLALNRWYHVAAVYNGGASSLSLYLNGRLVGSSTAGALAGTLAASTARFTLAKNATASANYFKGGIDEVRVFSNALSATQIQRMMCQKIENSTNSSTAPISGSLFTKNIDGTALTWTELLTYFRFDNYRDDVIDDLKTWNSIDNGAAPALARIYNVKYPQTETAPLPYITIANGDLATAVNNPTNFINGNDVTDANVLGAIVNVKHTNTIANSVSHVGLIVDTNRRLTVNGDSGLTNSYGLTLNGEIDLTGRSQLIQTNDSDLTISSSGRIQRDQQGTSNSFNYNYWSSPVSTINTTANNNGYSISGVFKDGTTTTPQDISWVGDADGSATSPISLSNYWQYTFRNQTDSYANWEYIGPTGSLNTGDGFTLKGSGAAGSTQNYTFVGKPNNGLINRPVAAGNLALVGNPYPSALDADEFIRDNINPGGNAGTTGSIIGTLYFWQHSPSNNSHVTVNYIGGYATYTLAGGTVASGTGLGGAGTGDPSLYAFRPRRYVPVGQGFFVEGATSQLQSNIQFRNSQRAFVKEDNTSSTPMLRQAANTASTTNFESPSTNDYKKIWFFYTSANQQYRETLLSFMNEFATDAYDNGYDAVLFDENASDMYFLLGETKLVIQGVGTFNESSQYPIGVKNEVDGNVKFEISQAENWTTDQPVYIYDSELDTYNDINGSEFQINLPAGTYDTRFSIRFTNIPLSTNTPMNPVNMTYATESNALSIVNTDINRILKSVRIYNLLGQEIDSVELERGDLARTIIPLNQYATGTYLVQVETNAEPISGKIIVK
ncbi:choice-of-anchor D domain-containing protein [Flavobacterium sp.]|uniref:choice-of-anchor D domain-containing protein n=1 Tax=Flavobacterium sp. TaxID=239 RepID=UPI00262B7C17|nr:choice-of-anchor D domain-containing protein [Flavobacterium sp.]